MKELKVLKEEKAADKKGNVFTPTRAAIQIATARYAIRPFHFFYSKLKIEGRENLPKTSSPVLIVSNHLSYFDPPILVVATDRPMGFFAKLELFKSPMLRRLIQFYGAIPVDREKPSLSSIKTIKHIFKCGWSVSIFIEGTRSKTPGCLGKPHTGAAYIAWTNKVPILPIGLIDTNKPWGKGGTAVARIGEVMQPSADLEATTWAIMERLSSLTGYSLPQR